VLLETETDTERREKLLAARFRDTERESAGVGLRRSSILRGDNYIFRTLNIVLHNNVIHNSFFHKIGL
jgi:hypothetical protein